MEEYQILFIALLTSVIGIIILSLLSKGITLNETTIEKINQGESPQEVLVVGRVGKVSSSGDITFIDLLKEEVIKVVVFDNYTINEGSWVEVKGSISEYKGSKELIAKEIKIR